MKKEKSLGDVYQVLEEFTKFTKKQFDLQATVLEKITDDVRDLRRGQLAHDKRFDEVDRTIRAISRAIDGDSVKIIDHERRITRLEFKRS